MGKESHLLLLVPMGLRYARVKLQGSFEDSGSTPASLVGILLLLLSLLLLLLCLLGS